jgi:hypothetical protein
MKKELIKLANHLDKLGHLDLADELDRIVKSAQDSDLGYSEVTFEDRHPVSQDEVSSSINMSLPPKNPYIQQYIEQGRGVMTPADPNLAPYDLSGASPAPAAPPSATSTPASVPAATKPTQSTTSTSCSLKHSSGTKLSDSWGTYVIVSPSEVRATSKQSSKSVKLTPAYSGWCKVVGNLNKLKPSTTTPSAPATNAPTETSAPAAKAPAPFELEKAMQEASIDQRVAGKFMRMLTRGVLGELSVFNPKTVSGQKEKVKQLIISKSRGQADGITDAEAQQIVDALASSAAAKLTAKSSNEFIIGQLAKIATELDQAELYAEADILDEIIRNL